MNSVRFLFSALFVISSGSVLQAMDTDKDLWDATTLYNRYIDLVGTGRNIKTFYESIQGKTPACKSHFLKNVLEWSIAQREDFNTFIVYIKKAIDDLDPQKTSITFASAPSL